MIITWKKILVTTSKAIISLPFVVVGMFGMVVVFICSFLWDCATGEPMSDDRMEKVRRP